MDRLFTTYCDVKNYDLEIKYTYWLEGDEMSVEQVKMGRHDVTAPFLDYCLDQIEESVWDDIRSGGPEL